MRRGGGYSNPQPFGGHVFDKQKLCHVLSKHIFITSTFINLFMCPNHKIFHCVILCAFDHLKFSFYIIGIICVSNLLLSNSFVYSPNLFYTWLSPSIFYKSNSLHLPYSYSQSQTKKLTCIICLNIEKYQTKRKVCSLQIIRNEKQ